MGQGQDGGGPALVIRGVDKWFGRNHANRSVSLTVARGSIHGIVGENGAGKSTLMNVVYGTLPADGGDVWVRGRRLAGADPRAAIAAGIGMVHQHFMLVDSFTAPENLVLAAGGSRPLGRALAEARAALERLGRDYGLEVPLTVPVGELPVGTRQRLEILKALHRGAELLILDEPTGVLTPQETEHLFRMLRAWRDQGRTVILITHKLKEIMALTDRVTVMRGGAVVAEVATAETTAGALAAMMVGRRVELTVARSPARPGPVVLEATELAVCDDRGRLRVPGLSLTVRAGEIVGIAGVSGNGQSELLEALAGMRRPVGGSLRLNGRLTAGPGRATDAAALRRVGVAHVPEDRERVGLVGSFSAWENSILGDHTSALYNGWLLLHRRPALAVCRSRLADYDIRPPEPWLSGASFSGGNQQKLVLAREIGHEPVVFLVGQPTRGVDIGAVELIHRRLVDLRDRGAGILLVSADLDEVLALADRILVMFDGRITGELSADAADDRRLGLLMAGATVL